MIQSIDRAMQLIGVISETEKDQWLVAELAEKTGLPISTVYRLLQSLETHGLVTQHPQTKHYELGDKWMELGLKKYEKLDIRAVSRPILEALAQEVRETVYLNAPRNGSSIIVDRIDSPRNVRIIDSIGERIPMPIGAANKIFLAFSPPADTAPLLERLIPDETERSRLKQQLQDIRRSGAAISRGEKTKGTVAVCAPVFDFEGRLIAAISIEALESQITDGQLEQFTESVISAADRISSAMGMIP